MYRFFDSRGPTTLPLRRDVVRLASEHGVITALVADANVCLDLAAFGSDPTRAAVRHVHAFVRDIAESGVDVLPGFGLAELSLDRATWRLDAARLESIERNISIAIDSAPGRVEERSPEVEAPQPIDAEMFLPWVPLFKFLYVCLLKVSVLSQRGLGRDASIKNVHAFVEWMCEDLGNVSALSLQAAVAIFGGDSLARRLIGAGKNPPLLSDVWGGAWDMFYVHQLFAGTLYPTNGTPHSMVFVTRDRACYQIFSGSRLEGAVHFDEERRPLLVGVTADYPHFTGHQAELGELFKATFLSRMLRITDGKRATEEHLDETILKVETEWRASHR